MGNTYTVRRLYQRDEHAPETVAIGLTLEDAQAYCRDPETSSTTAESEEAQQRTVEKGPWFCAYDAE